MKKMILSVIALLLITTGIGYCGVVVEGNATGIEELNTIEYQSASNSFNINNSMVFNNPVSCDELIEIIDAVNLDERIGVSVTLRDELIVYGKLHKRSETAGKLEDADNFIRSVVFAEYARLRKYALPQGYKPVVVKSRERSSIIYLQLSDFNFTQNNGKYIPASVKAEIMLIPMATYTAPDGGYLPDYDALEKGLFQKEDKANADHMNQYKSSYMQLPPLKEAIKVGQAAAFIRFVRDNGINLDELNRSLIEGVSLTLVGKHNQEITSKVQAETMEVAVAKPEVEVMAEIELDKMEIQPIETAVVGNVDYAENIRQIFLIDKIIGNSGKIKLSRESVNDGSYIKYRKAYLNGIKDPENIDLEQAPQDFKTAFEGHIVAWEKTLAWLSEHKIEDGQESFTAFYEEHGKYRNELQDTYNKCKEIAEKYQTAN